MTKPQRSSISSLSLSRRLGSPLAAVSVAATLFAACGTDYESCEAQRNCEPSGGAEGGAAGAGAQSGGAGGGGGAAIAGESNSGGAAGADGMAGAAGASGGAGAGGGAKGTAGENSGGSDVMGGSGGAAAGNAGAGGEGGGSGPRCGDAVVDANEACDDGNDDPADGCRPNCTFGPKEVIAGRYSSCAIYGDGAAKCWGYNGYGILGQRDEGDRGISPGQLGAKLQFIKIGNTVGKFTSLSMMEHLACGVVQQRIWCWGADHRGQLGQGTSTEIAVLVPVFVDVGGNVKSVSVGDQFACALLIDGSVKCWGVGASGRRGVGSIDDFGDQPSEMGASGMKPPPVQLSDKAVQLEAGVDFACAALASGSITCWGANGSGLLGIEAKRSSSGGLPGEVPPMSVKIKPSTAPPVIGHGRFHVCAILDDWLKCWGGNGSGELGLGNTTPLGDDPGEMAALDFVPVSYPLGSDAVVSVHGGYRTTCALLASGSAKCWGAVGDDGHLGQPRLIDSMGNIGDAPDEMRLLPAIDFGPGVKVRSLATGLGYTDSTTLATRVHSCALLSTGDVKCWGSNEHGQLGLGHTMPVGLVASDLGANMKAVPLD